MNTIEADVRGYRGWILGNDDHGPVLRSVSFTKVAWATVVQRATCQIDSFGRKERRRVAERVGLPVPDPGVNEAMELAETARLHLARGTCSCGIYGRWTIGRVSPSIVLGEVALSGVVVPGTDGFRAECVEITKLWVLKGSSVPEGLINYARLRGQLMMRYGVPVGTAIMQEGLHEAWAEWLTAVAGSGLVRYELEDP